MDHVAVVSKNVLKYFWTIFSAGLYIDRPQIWSDRIADEEEHANIFILECSSVKILTKNELHFAPCN